MRMTLELLCEMPAFPPSLLERAEQAWSRHDDLQEVLDCLLPDEDFRSIGDALVASFALELLPHLRRFYLGQGECLADVFSRRAIDHLDRRIADRMQHALLVIDAADALELDDETFEALLRAELALA
jgi:hypothetical protein